MVNKFELDIITPIELNPRFSSAREVASSVIWQHERFGVKRFAFFTLSKGWRSIGYPPKEEYIRCAEMAAEVQRLVKEYDVEFGWFIALTVKSGASDEFVSPVREDGTVHPFSSCPLDPEFRRRLAEDVALFAGIAKPKFIFTEDDFSLKAIGGCFCENHLNEFAKRMGRYYSREELIKIIYRNPAESEDVLRKWHELARDSLVELGRCIRVELDKVAPDIHLGCMQAGGADSDGDCTESLARAMAGNRHTPYSRLYGTFYSGVEVKKIPEEMYHPLYSKQHMGDNFKFYHESDPYPHNKFYTSAKHMKTMMGTVFSYGFDGSLLFMSGLSLVSENSTETAYGDMYAQEKYRFNEVYSISKKCTLKGVEIDYDPFWNTADMLSTTGPLWVKSISRFGIPFITVDSSVAFWDVRQARYADHDTIMKRLSKGLFLDGDAAEHLCRRGYSKYLGVEIGEDVNKSNTNLIYDIDAGEIVKNEFCSEDKGNRMPCAHMFCPAGTGRWREIIVIDDKCEVVSEAFTFRNELITPAMTRFENELGGKVVVMSLTLDGNNSQALYNYDRQNVIQRLLSWCNDEYVYVENIPDMSIVVNEANDIDGDLIGMLTMINLCEDKLNKVVLHLPEKWKEPGKVCVLDKNAVWQEISFELTDDGIKLKTEFDYCEPVYITFCKE